MSERERERENPSGIVLVDRLASACYYSCGDNITTSNIARTELNEVLVNQIPYIL